MERRKTSRAFPFLATSAALHGCWGNPEEVNKVMAAWEEKCSKKKAGHVHKGCRLSLNGRCSQNVA